MSESFGRYNVVGQLGRGAMGIVYLAFDPMLNRQVAVKTVDLAVEDTTEREFLRSRLLRDARAAAVLKHPNIVSVHDVFEDGDRAYVVMEYIEGQSLSARLKSKPAPDMEMLLKVLRQMADALDYTHARGVIHRDIKPANVMIDGDGNAKIMDFGIARITDTRTCTPTGVVMGTVEFMAPEQIRGETVDGRADQFALAVVAYQMLTGSTLFGPHTLATLTYKIVNETPPAPSTRNAALPQAVDAVLARALAKVPSERFADCREFTAALAQAFSGVTATMPVPARAPAVPANTDQITQTMVAAPQPPAAAKRSKPIAWAAVAAVLGVCTGLAVWKPWNRSPQPIATAAVTPPIATPGSNDPPAPAPKAVATHAKSTPPVVVAKPAATPEPEEPPELAPLPAVDNGGKDSTPFQAANRRGHEQLQSTDYAGAVESFTKAIGLHPKAAFAYYGRGVAKQNLGKNEDAIQDYTQAVRLSPDLALAYAARGFCLVHLHRDPDALEDFQRALQLKPALAYALNGRGGIYLRRKEYRTALADFDAAIQQNPRLGPAYLNRAHAKEALGDLRGAAEDTQREAQLRQRKR